MLVFSHPPIETLSSVAAVLRWLLELDSAVTSAGILQEAKGRGVIDASTGSNWKADGPRAISLLRLALRRGALPDSQNLGVVLHGIGELAARCHARFDLPVRALLAISRRHIDFGVLMDTGAALDEKSRRPPSFEELASAQWMSDAQMGWTDFRNASWRLHHPWINASGVYGFAFIVRVCLRTNLVAADRWIEVHPKKIALATIGRAVAELGRRTNVLRPVLRSSSAALKLLAAAACVSPVFPPPQPVKVRDVLTMLVANGFDSGDAIWIAGSLAKEALHQRYRLEDARQSESARLRYLEKHPEAAMGGFAHADAEREWLTRRLDDANLRYDQLLPMFEAMLAELAVGWPTHGLSVEQMGQLENIFVGTPEIRFRLACKLQHDGNRNWLLSKNLEQVKLFLGLANPNETLGTPLELADRFATHTAPWAAQSAVLLFQEHRRGIGRRTSDLLREFTVAAEHKLTQPFFAARASQFWQYASTRAANAYLFALMVVTSTPEDSRGSVEKLNEIATEHARKLLSLPVPSQPDPRAFDRLAANVVANMSLYAAAEHLRELWASSPHLGIFPRALAIWSSPRLIDRDQQSAVDLFASVGSMPLSRHDRDRRMSNLLTLLDCAVAACAKAGRRDLLNRIKDFWPIVYEDWAALTVEWANAAAEFIAAVDIDGPERAKICCEPAFANTWCKRLVDEQNEPAS